MERKNDKKNILIIFLLIIVFIMSVGFALLGSNVEESATGTVAGDWGVRFANEAIEPITKTDGVKVLTAQLDSNALKITLNTTFEKPGDKITYEFKVENTGSIDAYLKDVNVVGKEGNTEAIKLSYAVKSNDKATTYAEGTIAGQTANATTSPTTAAMLKKQVTVGENTTTENNYLTVTLEYLDATTDGVEEASSTYTLTLQYEQTNAN